MDGQELDTIFLQEIYPRLDEGDVDARNELLMRSMSRLQELARRMLRRYPIVGRWETADDVLQKAVVKLLRALETVRPESTREYLGLAAEQMRRVLIDFTRQYKHERVTIQVRSKDGDEEVASLDPEDAVEATASDLDSWCSLHEAVAELSVAQREVFGLAVYHGWTQSEIAALLQVNERTVRRIWTTALDAVKRRISEDG
jgi:RNA polymerase sigma factor (sigma-70 family)